MRLLLQLSLAAADDGSVLDRADDGSSCVPRRVLLVKRFMHRSRRRYIRPDGLREQLVRLLCAHSFAAADELADYHADGRADGRTDGCADEHANGHAYNASDRATNVNADGLSDSRLVYNCVRLAGVIVRGRSRRHLLRRSSCV